MIFQSISGIKHFATTPDKTIYVFYISDLLVSSEVLTSSRAFEA